MRLVGCSVVACILLSTCNFPAPRGNFDAGTNVLRDHDGDGVDDDRDGCPHLASATQADADADGIGDACDPSNSVRHRRVLFEGFYEALAADQWEVAGYGTLADWTIVVEGGKSYLRQNSSEAGRRQLRWRQPVTAAHVLAEAVVDSAMPDGQRTVGVLLADRSTLSSGSYGVCAVQRPSGGAAEQVLAAFYLADTAMTNSVSPWNSSLEGTTLLGGSHSQGGTEGRIDCELRRGSQGTSLFVARPETTANGLIGLHTEGVAASFDYLFVIAPR